MGSFTGFEFNCILREAYTLLNWEIENHFELG
jgi:hypothetical protein